MSYTGDITDPARQKFNLQYYLDLAKQLEDAGAHILCIKDMAGLLKPYAAEQLISELKKAIDIPIHLHTHNTSSIQSATYLKAIEAGVDVVDVALSSMSGLTSQPNFNSIAAMMQGQERENKVNSSSLNAFSDFWEATRQYYYPFETELKAGTSEVYEHEIPGGQYSNLRPQARGLGLEDQFHTITKNYRIVNDLLGGIVKVTPSSKVVGDMAMFMTSNQLTKEDILEQGETLAFPDSMKALMRGDLGQIIGGFPKEFQAMVLKGEEPYTNRPNAHLEPVDFDKEFAAFQKEFGPYVHFRMVTVWFKLNGQNRSIEVKDLAVKVSRVAHRKAAKEGEVGSPLQGSLSKILVKKGAIVKLNDPLFIIEAMKMESTITAPVAGKVGAVLLAEKTMVHQDDLIIEIITP